MSELGFTVSGVSNGATFVAGIGDGEISRKGEGLNSCLTGDEKDGGEGGDVAFRFWGDNDKPFHALQTYARS